MPLAKEHSSCIHLHQCNNADGGAFPPLRPHAVLHHEVSSAECLTPETHHWTRGPTVVYLIDAHAQLSVQLSVQIKSHFCTNVPDLVCVLTRKGFKGGIDRFHHLNGDSGLEQSLPLRSHLLLVVGLKIRPLTLDPQFKLFERHALFLGITLLLIELFPGLARVLSIVVTSDAEGQIAPPLRTHSLLH